MRKQEWSVAVAIGGSSLTEEEVEAVLDHLATDAPVVSYGPGSTHVQLSVVAGTVLGAARCAEAKVRSALAAAGVETFSLEGMEIVTADDLAASLEVPVVPTLVGVREIADLLGVTKQRASELARTAGFPPPLTTLAAGPVWAETTVRKFVETWQRRPGRPAAPLPA